MFWAHWAAGIAHTMAFLADVWRCRFMIKEVVSNVQNRFAGTFVWAVWFWPTGNWSLPRDFLQNFHLLLLQQKIGTLNKGYFLASLVRACLWAYPNKGLLKGAIVMPNRRHYRPRYYNANFDRIFQCPIVIYPVPR